MRLPPVLPALLLSLALLLTRPGLAGSPTSLRYALKAGQRLTYAQVYQTDSRSDARSLFEQGGEAAADASLVNALRIHLRAQMQVEVLEQQEQGWLLSVRWERLTGTITANGQPRAQLLSALQQGLALPLVLHLDQDGRFGPLHLDPALDPTVIALTRTLLAPLQCILPPTPSTTWEAAEEDPIGRFETLYQLDRPGGKDGITRFRKWLARHLADVSNTRSGELKVERSIQVQGSRRLGFHAQRGHLVFLDGHEIQRTLIAGKTVAGSDVRLALRLTGSGRLKAEALRAGQAWAKQRQQAGRATTLYVEASAEEQETAVQRKALGEATADQVFEALRAAESQGEKDGGAHYLKLKALAYVHPEACARMGERLASASPETLSMRLLASALSTTGSLPAQEALAKAIRSRCEDWPAMAVLIPALGQCQHPSLASIALLEDLAYGSTVVSIASTAQLMLGSMAFNLARQGEPEKAEGIVTTALARLEAARDPILAARFLLSLGNAGSPRSLPALQSWAITPDPELRALALYALRWIEAAPVEPLLLKALASDPEVRVRTKVIEAFKYRPPSAALVEALAQTALRDASPRVRLAALGSLWDLRGQFPEVLTTVEAARKDPDEDIRKQADSFLGK